MKEFDLKAAKAGKAVCTRDGMPVRIVCWDMKDAVYSIIALIEMGNCEIPYKFTEKGEYLKNKHNAYDLMMATEKKEGWVNLYKFDGEIKIDAYVFASKDEAKSGIYKNMNRNLIYIDTVKIEWEE